MKHTSNPPKKMLLLGLATLFLGLLLTGCQSLPKREAEPESYLVLVVEDAGLSPSYSDASPAMTSSLGAGRQKLKKGLNFLKFPDHQDFIEIRSLVVASPQQPLDTSWATMPLGAVVGRPAPGSLVLFPQKFVYRTEVLSRSGRNISTRVAISVPQLTPQETERLLRDLRVRASTTKDDLRWENIVVWDRAPAFSIPTSRN